MADEEKKKEEAKPEAKAEEKAAPKAEAKPEAKPDAKKDEKADTKKDSKKADAKSDSKEKKDGPSKGAQIAELIKAKKKTIIVAAAGFVLVIGVGAVFTMKGSKTDTAETAEKIDGEVAEGEEGKDGKEAKDGKLAKAEHDEWDVESEFADDPKVIIKPSVFNDMSRGFVDRFVDAAHSVHYKVEDYQTADLENVRLRTENLNLRRWAESLRFDCSAKDSEGETKDLQLRLRSETGSNVGRVLSSINYRPPTHLLAPQLYALAVSYFRAREDEKAAVIMTFLTGMEDSDTFRTPSNYLLTGIAWYRIDHYKLANTFFEKILSFPADTDNLRYQAQARLWRALISKMTGRFEESQSFLRELISHHPHSQESAWVNGGGLERLPAYWERKMENETKGSGSKKHGSGSNGAH